MTPEKQMDTLDLIMDIEENGFDPENEQHISGLQEMVNTGLIFKLQGSWWRLAKRLMDCGILNNPWASRR